MGLFSIPCPACGRHHMWFSGNLDQRCADCKAPTDAQLLEALGEVRDKLAASQVGLDPDAKRALYGNLRRLYRR